MRNHNQIRPFSIIVRFRKHRTWFNIFRSCFISPKKEVIIITHQTVTLIFWGSYHDVLFICQRQGMNDQIGIPVHDIGYVLVQQSSCPTATSDVLYNHRGLIPTLCSPKVHIFGNVRIRAGESDRLNSDGPFLSSHPYPSMTLV